MQSLTGVPPDKEVIREYLQASSLANATIHLGGFLENFWTLILEEKSTGMHLLKKTPTGFDIGVPMFKREAPHKWTWSYNDPDKGVSGKVYPVISTCLTYPALVELASKSAALGAEVTLTTKEALGVEELDEMRAREAPANVGPEKWLFEDEISRSPRPKSGFFTPETRHPSSKKFYFDPVPSPASSPMPTKLDDQPPKDVSGRRGAPKSRSDNLAARKRKMSTPATPSQSGFLRLKMVKTSGFLRPDLGIFRDQPLQEFAGPPNRLV
ncbi:hypothetical protein DFH06DRAFT_1150650 [Mycena polygramma]|nr:hypothetical protein DFH06DRAFT_1150650 [Mycena polygramma]